MNVEEKGRMREWWPAGREKGAKPSRNHILTEEGFMYGVNGKRQVYCVTLWAPQNDAQQVPCIRPHPPNPKAYFSILE